MQDQQVGVYAPVAESGRPREAPPLDYYSMMNELKVIREDLDVLAQMAAATGFIDANAIDVQLHNLRKTSEKIGMAVAGEYDEEDQYKEYVVADKISVTT